MNEHIEADGDEVEDSMDCDKKWNSLRHGLYKMKSVALALVILMQFNAFAARTWGADNDLLMKLERGWNHLQLLEAIRIVGFRIGYGW